MLKKSLIAIAVLAIAMPAVAGQMKIHGDWPCTCSYQEETVAVIPVKMSVGYYVHIVDQSPIILTQYGTDDPYHTYQGCMSSIVDTNFNVRLNASVVAGGTNEDLKGDWSVVTLNVNGVGNPTDGAVATPGATDVLNICVEGKNIQIQNGTPNVEVEVNQLTITAMPDGAPGCCSTPGTPVQANG